MFARVLIQATKVALYLGEHTIDVTSAGSCATGVGGRGPVVVAFAVAGRTLRVGG